MGEKYPDEVDELIESKADGAAEEFKDKIKRLKQLEENEDKSNTREASDEDLEIEFFCGEELYGKIPEPQPASEIIPEWYDKLDFIDSSAEFDETKIRTVKNCMPFMDALKKGWIIPLAADVEYEVKEEGVEFSWDFEEKLVGNHQMAQLGGESFPLSDKPVMKFYNYWGIDVPEGYSVLFTSPLNRIEKRFQTFSGIVDCDSYQNLINFPFLFTAEKEKGVIEKGTPIAHVIPFKRENDLTKGEIRRMTDKEVKEFTDTRRKLKKEDPGLYRKEIWRPKENSKIVDKE